MTFRRQPPAYAPVPGKALRAGMRELVWPPRGTVDQARETLRRFFDARSVALTSSGTAALAQAMSGARRIVGEAPVAMPAYACYDLATAAVGSGSRVVLYDLDPATLAPERDSLAAAVSAGVSAVVVVHLYGIPVDLTPLQGVVNGTLIIEDAAQGAGAGLRGRPLGSLGSLGVLSFGRGKGVTTGRGGALLANDAAGQAVVHGLGETERVPAGWRDVAAAAVVAGLSRPSVFWVPALLPFLHVGETVYKLPAPPGPGSRAAGALLTHTWPLVETEATVRRRNAERLLRVVRSTSGFDTVAVPSAASPGYLRVPVIDRSGGARSARMRAGRPLGVATGYPHPLSALRPLAGLCVNADEHFPGARHLCERLVTLPVHGLLGERDLEELERWIGKQG